VIVDEGTRLPLTKGKGSRGMREGGREGGREVAAFLVCPRLNNNHSNSSLLFPPSLPPSLPP